MGGAGFHLLGMVAGFLGLLFTAAIIFLVIKLLQKKRVIPPNFMQPPAPTQPPAADPLSVLDERLAKGDIDVDDYRARRSALLDGGLNRPGPNPEPPVP